MSTLEKKNDMTSGSIYKSLIVFAVPIALSNFFQQLYSAVDGMVLGAFVGGEALSATNVSTILGLMICLFVGLGSGAGVVVARFFGAKDDAGVSRAVHTALYVSLISGAFLTVGGLLTARPILILMGYDFGENVLELSNIYMSIIFAGMIPRLVYNISAGILRAVGESKRSFYYLVAGGITNIVLDLLFVAVFKWGVAGAAIATVLSESLSAFLCMLHLWRTNESYKFSPKKLKMDKSMLVSIVKVGLPMGFLSMAYHLPNTLLQKSINGFASELGAGVMAGGTAYSKIGNFIDVAIASVETAVTTFVSQNIGAGRIDRVKKGARAGLVMSIGASIVLMIVVFAIAEPAISFIVKGDESSVYYGMLKLWCILPFYPIAAFTGVMGAVMQGGGATFEIMIQGIIFTCVVRMLIVFFVLPFWHELYVVYLTYAFTWLSQGISYIFYYKFGKWMKTRL